MSVSESKTQYSEPEYVQNQDKTKLPYYHADIEHKIPKETHDLLESYSHVPREQHSEHVHRIRDQAFDIRAYPCTGLGSWLVPQLRRQPAYPEILQRVKDGATVLDVGTFIGHDLRRLAFDGAPSDKLYGVDIVSHFDVGYDFFRDRETFQARFIEADFLSSDNAALASVRGKVDIIIVSQVLHQWDWPAQVRAAQALSTFTKPGSMIIGNQVGCLQAREKNNGAFPSTWMHDTDSWARMWAEVGTATGTRWETKAWLRTFGEIGWDPNDAAWMDGDVRIMEFEVRRVE